MKPLRAPGGRVLLAAATLAASAAAARAADLSGTTTTIARAYDVKQTIDDVQRVRSFRPVDQYLRLTLDRVGSRGAWTIDTDLRGRVDLATGRDGGQRDFQVLIASATWRAPRDLLRLRLGRQQSITGLGWHAFDGVRVDFDKLRRARFFVHAGFPLADMEAKEPNLDGGLYGAGITFVAPRHGSVGVEYERRRVEVQQPDGTWAFAREETAGLDLSFKTGSTTISANADYSVMFETFGETALLVQHEVRRKHVLTGRFDRVEHVFPTNTIWAVFDVNPYDDLRLSYEFRGDGGLRVGGYVARETYEDTYKCDPAEPPEDCKPSVLDEDIDRAAVSFAFTGKRRGKHRGEAGWQDGFSGKRVAARYDVDWDLTPRFRLGFGASAGRYENAFRLTSLDELYAVRARVHHDFGGRFDIAAEVEQFIGRDRDTVRGTLVLNAKLGAAGRDRPWWGGRWGETWGGGAPAKIEVIGPAQEKAEEQAEEAPQ